MRLAFTSSSRGEGMSIAVNNKHKPRLLSVDNPTIGYLIALCNIFIIVGHVYIHQNLDNNNNFNIVEKLMSKHTNNIFRWFFNRLNLHGDPMLEVCVSISPVFDRIKFFYLVFSSFKNPCVQKKK